MSSVATDDFLAAWRKQTATRVCLLLVELEAPGALELRFGTAETHTPDGNSWEMGLTHDVIRSRIGYMETGVVLSDTGFRLDNRSYAGLSAVRLSDALSAHRFQGATVRTYFWETSLTDWADALQVFSGKIDAITDVLEELVQFTCIQDRSWNIALPTLTVDQINYPNAPDANNGLVIPIVTGDHSGIDMRSPWASATANKSKQEDVGGGAGVVPLILVDPGTGSGDVKLVVAGHECKDILDRTAKLSAFIVANDRLAPIETSSGVTEVLGASESYITIDDDSLFAYYGVVPTDVWTGATPNTADDPRRAMDVQDETSFATLNQTAGKSILKLTLPNIGSLGRIDSVEVSLAFIGNAANTQNIQIRPWSAAPATGTAVATGSTGTTPQVLTGTYDAAYWDQNWNFGGPSTLQFGLQVDFAGAVANNKASVLWAAVKVKYRPQQSLVKAGFVRYGAFGQSRRIETYEGPIFPFIPSLVEQPKFSLEGQFYGNVKGAPDDGSGTYTGSATSLIERVPDTARWYLQEWGGVSSVETGATDFGSFVLGRDTMRNAQPSDFKLATHVSQLTNLAEILKRIGEQSLTAYVLDRFTDQWLFHVWKPGAAIDYDRTLLWEDILEMSAGVPSDVGLSQGVRVKYAFDHFKGRTLFEAFLSPNGSSQGRTLPTTRDQRLTVDSTNNKLDYVDGAGTSALTLTSATYTGIGLATQIRTRVRGIGTADALVFQSNFGFHISAGFNDYIDFTIGASTYAAHLDPFDYSAEGLAIEVAAKMSAAASATITCVYDHSTNKFTIGYAGTLNLKPVTGANASTCAIQVLGWNADTGIVTSGSSLFAVYADRFHFCNQNAKTFNLKFATGASTANNCAALLGYPLADTGAVFNSVASYQRGDRERAAEDSASDYGPKAEQVITADWIRDENSAVELRNRIFDLNSTPPTFAKIKTLRMPDLQIMRVVRFSDDIDEHVSFPRYGSDGSWGNKAMRAIEVEQSCGPSFHTEALLVES